MPDAVTLTPTPVNTAVVVLTKITEHIPLLFKVKLPATPVDALYNVNPAAWIILMTAVLLLNIDTVPPDAKTLAGMLTPPPVALITLPRSSTTRVYVLVCGLIGNVFNSKKLALRSVAFKTSPCTYIFPILIPYFEAPVTEAVAIIDAPQPHTLVSIATRLPSQENLLAPVTIDVTP